MSSTGLRGLKPSISQAVTTGKRSCDELHLPKHGKCYWNKPPPLLFFEALTLCHVREPSPSDAPAARMDSQSGTRESCGTIFLLAEAVAIGLRGRD